MVGRCDDGEYSAAVTLEDEARAELLALEAAGRLRTPRTLEGRQGTTAVVDGVEVTSFASNDYLGLAGDPRIAAAASAALAEVGVGAGASRLIIGNHRMHEQLERELAEWLHCGAARLFNTGYAANVSVLSALLGPDDIVFSDQLNHASIIDGCRLSRARVVVFPHRDSSALERELRAHPGGRRRLVVSETLFSMDGDIADVVALADLAKRHGAALMLDEAHALGVYGPEGRGVAATHEVDVDLLVGTLGKALGTFGAFVAASRAVCDLLWNRARPFVFSTGLPPAISAATCRALEIVRGTEGAGRREQVCSLARMLRTQLTAGGSLDAPIAPVIVGDDRATVALGVQLLEQRMLVAAVRPPTVPTGTSRLRISLSAGHRSEQVNELAALIRSNHHSDNKLLSL
jgi:8-amino-7-oxononanoate synthase